MIEIVKNDQLIEARIDSNRIFKITKSNVEFKSKFKFDFLLETYLFFQLKIEIIQSHVIEEPNFVILMKKPFRQHNLKI